MVSQVKHLNASQPWLYVDPVVDRQRIFPHRSVPPSKSAAGAGHARVSRLTEQPTRDGMGALDAGPIRRIRRYETGVVDLQETMRIDVGKLLLRGTVARDVWRWGTPTIYN